MFATTKAIGVINQLRDEKVISRYFIGGAVGAVFYVEPAQTQWENILRLFEKSRETGDP